MTWTAPALIVICLIVAAEAVLAVRRVRRSNARQAWLAAEREARRSEDWYWHHHRHDALRAAMLLAAGRFDARLSALIAKRDKSWSEFVA